MTRRGARGQAANEYLMIAGLITAMALIVLGYTYSPLRFGLVRAAACILGDVCPSIEASGGGGGAAGPGGAGGPGGGAGSLPGMPIAVCERTRDEQIRQLAYFADDVYDDDDPDPHRIGGPTGVPEGLEDAVFSDPSSGFRATLYEQPPGSKNFVLAFAGTDFKDIKGDLATDVKQALGVETAQYEEAARLSVQVKEWAEAKGGRLQLTGHSLGGGLAATGAMTSGAPAVTFNMARPSENTIAKYGTAKGWQDRLDNYQVNGEFLAPLQDATGLKAVGRQHQLPATSWDPVSRHLMSDVKNGIAKKIANDPLC